MFPDSNNFFKKYSRTDILLNKQKHTLELLHF